MKQNHSLGPSKRAMALVHIGLLVVLIEALILTALFLFGEHENSIYAFRIYCKTAEYLLLDIVLLLGGAILFEIAERDCRR